MVGAIFIAVVVGMWMAASMRSSFIEYSMSKRYLDMQSAMNLAESGLEEGVRSYLKSDWTGWTAYSNGYYKEATPGWAGNGLASTIKIYVADDPTNPSVAAEGTISDVSGQTIVKQIRVDMNSSSLFANGLLADKSVTISGNGVVVDSFDSSLGARTTAWNVNRFSNGSIASNSVAVDDVSLQNGDVYGYVALGSSSYNPNDLVGNNGHIHEYGWSGGGNVDPSRVTGDFSATLAATPAPAFGSWTDLGALSSASTLGNAINPMMSYQADSISLTGSNTLTIDGPTTLYVKGDFSMGGNSELIISNTGSLTLYVVGDVAITGNGIVNNTSAAEKMIIYGMETVIGNQTIKVAGNGTTFSAIYAPFADIELLGGGSGNHVHGAIVGYSIKLTGNQEFHYDENLKNLSGGGGLNISYWRELKGVGERLPFSTPSLLPPYF